jgi:hypothetical protein
MSHDNVYVLAKGTAEGNRSRRACRRSGAASFLSATKIAIPIVQTGVVQKKGATISASSAFSSSSRTLTARPSRDDVVGGSEKIVGLRRLLVARPN